MQLHAITCNTMQYHACLITADGAYHCPVGSIWLFFIYNISPAFHLWIYRFLLFLNFNLVIFSAEHCAGEVSTRTVQLFISQYIYASFSLQCWFVFHSEKDISMQHQDCMIVNKRACFKSNYCGVLFSCERIEQAENQTKLSWLHDISARTIVLKRHWKVG